MKKRSIVKQIPNMIDLNELRKTCFSTDKQDPEYCMNCLGKLQNQLEELPETAKVSQRIEIITCIAECAFKIRNISLAKTHLEKLVELAYAGNNIQALNLVYNNLGRIALMESNFKGALEYFQKALEQSELVGNREHQAGMCMNLSLVNEKLGNIEQSFKYVQQAIEIFKSLNNHNLMYSAKSNYANSLHKTGYLELALEVKAECLEYFEGAQNIAQVAKEKNSIATIYYDMGRLEEAIAACLESIKIREMLGDEEGIASIWLNLGVFYREYNNLDSAFEYYNKALKYYQKTKNPDSISRCLNNIGNYYLDNKSFDEALKYLLQAREINTEIGNVKGLMVVLGNIAKIYSQHKNDPITALEYMDESIRLANQANDSFAICGMHLDRINLLAMLNRLDEAQNILESTALQIEQNNYTKLFPQLKYITALVHEMSGRLELACHDYKEYGKLLNELQISESKEKIAEMKTRFETEKKEKEAEIYRLKNIELEAKNRQIKQQKNQLQETLDELKRSEIKYNFISEELTRNTGTVLIGHSEIIRNINKMIATVARSDNTNVLITGETGTGKEIIAKRIHQNSNRAEQHFYAVNCSAITESLFESQFFGHEKDAFTGATKTRTGWFEIANQSSLFLDEIGTLSFDQQAKMLRVLEERCIVRVGSHREIPINVRVISATNLNLLDKISSGDFRRDLYHRLAIFVIHIPPLRERKEDIPLLLKHFVVMSSQSLNKKITRIDKNVLPLLMEYDYPGNVRELKNMVDHAVLVAESSILDHDHFAIPMEKAFMTPDNVIIPLDELERNMLITALKQTNYNRVKTAKLLQVDRKVISRKIIKHRIVIPS